MYFISEKDGQNVQIELASAFVIFFPSIVCVHPPSVFLSVSPFIPSLLGIKCSVQGWCSYV